MKADLDRSAKDWDATTVAKQKAEEKQKELVKAQEDGLPIAKDLEVEKDWAIENMKRISDLEEKNRRLKVVIEQHPIEVKLKCNDAVNMAYIHSFSNAVRAAHRTYLDLEGIRAQMRDMLVAYMRNNPVHIENHLPMKDLVAFGMNFDFIPTGANFYDPDELL